MLALLGRLTVMLTLLYLFLTVAGTWVGLAAPGPLIENLDQSGSEQQEVGDLLRLTCTDSNPVEWKLPNNSKFKDYSDPSKDGRLVPISVKDTGQNKYESVLEIRKLQYTDTGLYICQSAPSSGIKSGGFLARKVTSREVYVFVKDNVDDHLLLHFQQAGGYGGVTGLRPDRESVIECKVTDAEAQVSLWIKNVKQPPNIQAHYNPERGFVIPPGTVLSDVPVGMLTQAECRAQTLNNFDQINLLLLMTEPTTSEITLNGTEQNAYENSKFQMDCNVNGIKKNQLSMVKFKWYLPAKDEISDSLYSRVHVISYDEQPKSRLIIKPLRVSDSGEYNCTVTFLEKSNSASTTVSVSKTEGQVSILKRSEPETLTINPKNGRLNLNARLTVFPIEMKSSNKPKGWKIVWYSTQEDPLTGITRQEVKSSNLQPSTMMSPGLHPDGRAHITPSLLGRKLEAKNSAVYTLRVDVGGDLKQDLVSWNVDVSPTPISIQLIVTEAVNTSAPVNERFLEYGHEYNVACLASGKPFADIEIAYKPCLKDDTCQWTKILPESLRRSEGTYQRADILEIQASESGTYKCSVSRDDGATAKPAIAELIVTDIVDSEKNRGLAITDQHTSTGSDGDRSKYYEKDGLELTCSVQKYDYRFMRWEFTSPNGTRQILGDPKEHREGYDIKSDTSSPLSNKLILTLSPLSPHDNGTYQCTAQPKDGGIVVRVFKLKVTPIEKPKFSPSTSPYKVSAKYQTAASLRCVGYGSPNPKLSWFKDGRPFSPRDGIALGPNDQQLNISRVVPEDTGLYTCRLTNRVDTVSRNMTLTVLGGPKAPWLSETGIWVLCLSLILAVCIVLVLCSLLCWQKRKDRQRTALLQDLYDQLMSSAGDGSTIKSRKLDPNRPLNRQAENLPYDRRYELSKDLLSLEQLIGEGQFGRVWKGTLAAHAMQLPQRRKSTNSRLPIAVKVPLNGRSLRDQKALLDELKIMIHLGQHVNVLGLIGAITKFMVKGELYVVVELCQLGSVLDYVKQQRVTYISEIVNTDDIRPNVAQDGYLAPNRMIDTSTTTYQAECDPNWAQQLDENRRGGNLLTTSDLLSFSYQAANGMDFLAQKTLIHRDLAARNLLLTENHIVKIADFGLARQDQTYHIQTSKNVPLPIKWMALESILDQDFTVKSDVWSFGVAMWELFSLGQIPYPTQPLDPSFVSFLRTGNRLEQPEHAPDEVYHLMRQCWLVSPDDRPTFAECRSKVGEQLEKCSKQLFDKVQKSLSEDERERIHDYINWRPSLVGEEFEKPISSVEAATALNSPRYKQDFEKILPQSPPVEIENQSYMMNNMNLRRGQTTV